MTRGQTLKLIGGATLVLLVVLFFAFVGSCQSGRDTPEAREDEVSQHRRPAPRAPLLPARPARLA